jgi:hypothetical protein
MNKKIVGILVLTLLVASVVNPIVYSRNNTNEENIVSDNDFGNKCAFSKMGDDLVNIAVTEEFDTSSAPVISLSFLTKYNFEPDFEPSKGEIYIKEAGDHPWTMIKTYSSTQSLGWIEESVDIPDEYNGKIIQLMFKFITFSSIMGLYSSWYVDDIVVDGLVIDPPNVIHYSEDFEGYNVGDSWGDWVIVDENGEDNTPPLTYVSVYGEIYGEEPEYWLTPETFLSFIASDEGSGVNTTYYRICYLDMWSDWMEWDGESFNLSDDGLYYLEWYSEDYAENLEVINLLNLTVDSKPPEVPLRKLGEHTTPNIWAFICSYGDDSNYPENPPPYSPFAANALHAYNTMKMAGLDDSHIDLALNHANQPVRIRNNNLMYGPNGIKGDEDDPVIDYSEEDFRYVTLSTGEYHQMSFNRCLLHMLYSFFEKIKKSGEKDCEIWIYLTGHGGFDTDTQWCYLVPGSESAPLALYPREDYFQWRIWMETKNLDYEKLVIVGDFCFSGCFMDLNSTQPNNKQSNFKNLDNVVLIASAGLSRTGDCRACGKEEINTRNTNEDFIGGIFSIPFWDAIQNGRTAHDAFHHARNFIPVRFEVHGEILGEGTDNETVDQIQHPQIYDPDNILDSPTNVESADEQTGFKLVITDEGGIGIQYIPRIISNNPNDGNSWEGKPVDYKLTGSPVGPKAVYYRIWYNGLWSPWVEYDNSFSIEGEGVHYLEWYGEDLLRNKENIKNETIIIDLSSPSSPLLISPESGTSVDATPSFNWENVEDISDVWYILQIATDTSFTNIVYEQIDLLSTYYPLNKTENLSMGDYYWRVRAVDGVNNIGPWSETWSFTVTKENSPPNKPDKPEGIKKGKPGEEYTYSTSTTDVDADKVFYIFDWGDLEFGTTFSYDSGETINSSHIWAEQGEYSIKAKAIDEHGYESEWSDPLSVSMPKTKIYNPMIQLLFRILERFPILNKILNQIISIN